MRAKVDLEGPLASCPVPRRNQHSELQPESTQDSLIEILVNQKAKIDAEWAKL
jgi:hypothetical protein